MSSLPLVHSNTHVSTSANQAQPVIAPESVNLGLELSQYTTSYEGCQDPKAANITRLYPNLNSDEAENTDTSNICPYPDLNYDHQYPYLETDEFAPSDNPVVSNHGLHSDVHRVVIGILDPRD